jgi:hypothetical protein
MCGGEPNIRIEKAGNGFVVDSYHPGSGDTPGKHKRNVATRKAHVHQLVDKHLGARPSKKRSKRRA